MKKDTFSQKELSILKDAARFAKQTVCIGNVCDFHPEMEGERRIWNGACIGCDRERHRERLKKRTKAQKARAVTIQKAWKAKNGDKIRERNRERYSIVKDKLLDNHKRWRNKPKITMLLRDHVREYTKMKNNSLHLGDEEMIDLMYAVCRQITAQTGKKHTVDHIVPLMGENVCGLHVEWNLQILPKGRNSSKGNKLPKDSLCRWEPGFPDTPIIVAMGAK